MAVLLDTSVLCRLTNQDDAVFPVAAQAIAELHRRQETLYITAQNLIEFRNVATRPLSGNGLGLPPDKAASLAADLEAAFDLLPETPDIFPAWKALVDDLGVIGKQVHDARLVAVCHVHSVTSLLTFNVGHFKRLSGGAPGVTILDPSQL
jgi:predicted nucleic acid-binding protein